MFLQKVLRAGLALMLLGALTTLSPAVVSTARSQSAQQAGISPGALDALKRMGKTLSTKQFSFQSWTFRGYAGPNGELLHIAHTSKIIYRRPDRLSISVTGDDGTIKILYDGTALVLYGAEQKQYVSLPVTGGIDKALDLLEERTGTDFPLSDLLSDDPGEAVASGVTSGGKVGTSTIDGVRCNHFFFVQALDDLELELWLEDNEGALPRRFVVTYRSLPGRPIFVADLSGWDFSIQTPDSAFAEALQTFAEHHRPHLGRGVSRQDRESCFVRGEVDPVVPGGVWRPCHVHDGGDSRSRCCGGMS